MDKKLLVTGGTTFVSRTVAEYFSQRDYDVYVLNRGTKPQPEGVTLIKCDRLNIDGRLRDIRFDAVIDVTAYNERHINTMLDSLGKFGDYVFISSSAVYPETNPQPFSENQHCGENKVWGGYGTDKLRAERVLQMRVPNAYILRPPYLYGKYENLYRAPFVFDCAVQNRKFYLPQNGSMNLQFFSAFDLCRFIEILITKHPQDKIFNVGNPDSVSVKQWAELCYSTADKTPEFVSVDKSFFQRDYFCFYDYEYKLDVTKMLSLFDNLTNLSDGLREEYRWYDNHQDEVAKKPYLAFTGGKLTNNGNFYKYTAFQCDKM